jgi:probable rRNA maturation factor
MISINISETVTKQLDRGLIDIPRIEKAIEVTLEQAGRPDGDLTILITDDEHIQQLNRDYLDIDEPTDVLSFPADYTDPDTNSIYLGDVILSYQRASEQVEAERHSLVHELELLVVHGVLHLFGYDHIESKDKQRMWSIQGKILSLLENPLAPP